MPNQRGNLYRNKARHRRAQPRRPVLASLCPLSALGLGAAACVAAGAAIVVFATAGPDEFYAGLALAAGAAFLFLCALGIVARRDQLAPPPAPTVAAVRRVPASLNLVDGETLPVDRRFINGGYLNTGEYNRTGRLEIEPAPYGQDRGA